MKKNIYLSFIPILFFFLFYGCSSTFSTLTNDEVDYPATNQEDIAITTNDTLNKPFKEVGYISTTQSNIDVAKKVLRRNVAEMGGNALLDFKVTIIRQYIVIIFIPVPVDRYICRGLVVRYI